MTEQNPRWIQRLANFERALAQLSSGVELSHRRSLSDLEQQGLIRAFEFCHELAWNVMRDYFAWQGNTAITGSRDAVREAFSKGLIKDGEGWMEMIRSRNQTSHTYNKPLADEITARVQDSYHDLSRQFNDHMQALRDT